MDDKLIELMAYAAKELTQGMLSRVKRLPDKEDYKVVFRRAYVEWTGARRAS